MICPAVLLAADQVSIKVLVFVVMGLIYLIKKYFEADARQPRRPAGAPPARPVEAPPRNAPMPPQNPGNRQQLDDEIAEFLRRAAQKRSQAAGQGAGRPAPPSGPLAPAPRAQPVRPQAQTARQQVQPSRPPIEPPMERPIGESVAEHVQKHLDTRSIGTHAEQISQVGQTTRQLQSHLQSAFSHEVGQLAHASEGDAPANDSPASNSATSLAALLAEPGGMRQAIMLNEILQRPVHRW